MASAGGHGRWEGLRLRGSFVQCHSASMGAVRLYERGAIYMAQGEGGGADCIGPCAGGWRGCGALPPAMPRRAITPKAARPNTCRPRSSARTNDSSMTGCEGAVEGPGRCSTAPPPPLPIGLGGGGVHPRTPPLWPLPMPQQSMGGSLGPWDMRGRGHGAQGTERPQTICLIKGPTKTQDHLRTGRREQQTPLPLYPTPFG